MFNILEQLPEFERAAAAFRNGKRQLLVSGVAGSCKAIVAGHAFMKGGCRGAMLVVVPGLDQIRSWRTDLEALYPEAELLIFDPAEALPFEVVAASREPTAGRLRVLAALAEGRSPLVIAPAEALLPRLIPKKSWQEGVLTLRQGGRYDYGELTSILAKAGYLRSGSVSAPGQFSIRGSVVDIYPFAGTAVRGEFWGDELTSLKQLDPESQRSRHSIDEITIWPAREFIYQVERREAAVERINQAYQERRLQVKGNRNTLTRLNQRLGRFLEMAADGSGGSLNLLQPYFYPEQVSLFDYLPEDSLVVLDEPGRIEEQLKARNALLETDYRRLLQNGESFTGWREYYLDSGGIWQALAEVRTLSLMSLLHHLPEPLQPEEQVSLTMKGRQTFLGRPDLLAAGLAEWRRRGSTVLLLSPVQNRLKQLERELNEQHLAAHLADHWNRQLEQGINLGLGFLSEGFEFPGLLAVVTSEEIYGRHARGNYSPRRRKVDSLLPELKIGDYVVHVHHGIGRYLGIVEKESDGRKRDYLAIEYAEGARLFIPVDQVGLVQRYIGPEGTRVRLSKLGGGQWNRVKQRVKQRVKELASDLLKLYAERSQRPGYAFSPDTTWQQEFEAEFPYEETPDQIRAIGEVKHDMESPNSMDRLVCGDVGFGKTEVAIRAAFKAVQDSKQVAVLVPTTVLAQQHLRTFQERFEHYPIKIALLSRFRTPKQQRETVEAIRTGLVDIVIGTHRLLSNDIHFKNLGLLIVDEEQRFGVGHKEKIKLLRTNVDCLTLTATPIPRTLQMSLSGVRDLSLIETPPEDRLPVQTYVVEYHPELIRDALLRERERGGQIFYLHNRVQTIYRTAAYLQGLVPEVSVRVAHGQMDGDELERVMLSFLNREFDCLICTTIIENGLDIPNVNTLIVEHADQFGLAQLYQLRGRVGRSNRLAYAYFTFNRDKVLSEQAEKRLRALQEFTEFGSGFKLALRDLEIRGAGNILGAEQHGHMAAVGFDLYNQLLQEAVLELKGERPVQEKVAPAFELPVDTYLPDSYINDPGQKVEIYRRLSLAATPAEVGELAAELRDRFGPLPDPVNYLLMLAGLKSRARELAIGDVQLRGSDLVVRFEREAAPKGMDLARWSRVFGKRVTFSAIGTLEVKIKTRGLEPKQLVQMLTTVLRPEPANTTTDVPLPQKQRRAKQRG